MCCRYVIVSKLGKIGISFNAALSPDLEESYKPNYNITAGDHAPVILQEDPYRIRMARFGMTPFFSSKDKMIIEARAEGKHNPENMVNYSGAMGIIQAPEFRKPIRSQRCVIIMDCFYDGPGPTRLANPYVFYVRNSRPVAVAGIYDHWKDPSGKIITGFSIITVAANHLLRELGCERMPMILRNERTWLSQSTSLAEVTRSLDPYRSDLMNAYPVADLRAVQDNSVALVKPIGNKILPEVEITLDRKRVYPSRPPMKEQTFDEYTQEKQARENSLSRKQ